MTRNLKFHTDYKNSKHLAHANSFKIGKQCERNKLVSSCVAADSGIEHMQHAISVMMKLLPCKMKPILWNKANRYIDNFWILEQKSQFGWTNKKYRANLLKWNGSNYMYLCPSVLLACTEKERHWTLLSHSLFKWT